MDLLYNGLFAAYTYRCYLYGQWHTDSFFSRQVLIRIGCIWVVGYLGFLTAVLAMAHHCYSRRYRTAAVLVRQYRQHLMALEDYYTERSQINDSSAGTTAKDK